MSASIAPGWHDAGAPVVAAARTAETEQVFAALLACAAGRFDAEAAALQGERKGFDRPELQLCTDRCPAEPAVPAS